MKEDRFKEFFGAEPGAVVGVESLTDLGFADGEIWTAEIRFENGNKYRGTFMYSDVEYPQWYVAPEWCEFGLIKASSAYQAASNPNCAGRFTMSPFEAWDFVVGYFNDDIAEPLEAALDAAVAARDGA